LTTSGAFVPGSSVWSDISKKQDFVNRVWLSRKRSKGWRRTTDDDRECTTMGVALVLLLVLLVVQSGVAAKSHYEAWSTKIGLVIRGQEKVFTTSNCAELCICSVSSLTTSGASSRQPFCLWSDIQKISISRTGCSQLFTSRERS
jgi:hypothetical protein